MKPKLAKDPHLLEIKRQFGCAISRQVGGGFALLFCYHHNVSVAGNTTKRARSIGRSICKISAYPPTG